jgi:peptide/nickel transport system permease protein
MNICQVRKKMARKTQNMARYIFKRIILMIPILIAVLIFTWILAHMMDVNPIMSKFEGWMEVKFGPIEREKIRMGWYDPWYVQLGIYLKNFFLGDWGESYIVLQGAKVLDIIGTIFPRTIELMLFSIVVVPIIAIKLGVSSARARSKPKDAIIRGFGIIGAGLPLFYMAILVQLFMGRTIRQFTYGQVYIPVVYSNSPSLPNPIPPGGAGTGFRLIDCILYNDQIYLWDTILHLILPAFCMIFVSLSSITRQTRSSMLDVLDQDYIRTARAKGVKEDDVINKHALRNGILPTSHIITGGIALSLLGSMFVEFTFNYGGMGYYLYVAITEGDYTVTMGILVFSTIIIISGTLIADIAYTIIDPRIMY